MLVLMLGLRANASVSLAAYTLNKHPVLHATRGGIVHYTIHDMIYATPGGTEVNMSYPTVRYGTRRAWWTRSARVENQPKLWNFSSSAAGASSLRAVAASVCRRQWRIAVHHARALHARCTRVASAVHARCTRVARVHAPTHQHATSSCACCARG